MEQQNFLIFWKYIIRFICNKLLFYIYGKVLKSECERILFEIILAETEADISLQTEFMNKIVTDVMRCRWRNVKWVRIVYANFLDKALSFAHNSGYEWSINVWFCQNDFIKHIIIAF